MRIVFAFLLLTGCLATSDATLKLLKSKIKPLGKYKAVKYIQQPIVISEPLPATYARPVSTYSAHVSTYSVSSPSIATYALPVQTYSVPYAYESSYAPPVAVYAQPLYDIHSTVDYAEHQPVYFEPFVTRLVEEHFSHYNDHKRR